MGRTRFDISISLDGFVAGPDPDLEHPLGRGGERLHEWAVATEAFRARHGNAGTGERGLDDDVVADTVATTGAVVMGRRMFSGGAGPWAEDPRRDGWWGSEPPFRVPVFVLTHHARPPLALDGGTTFHFVTDGLASALAQARSAAGERDVSVAGGGSVVDQCLAAGEVDVFQLHVAPVLLGGGVRLFAGVPPEAVELEVADVVASPLVTHVRYRVRRPGASRRL